MKRMLIFAFLIGFIGVGSLIIAGEKGETSVKLSTLEGVLRVHPKFLYKYYIVAYGGQTCALYGDTHTNEPEKLKDMKPGTQIRVRGCLGTFLHSGGSKDNPSPFPRTWVIYMELKEVTELRRAVANQQMQ